MNDGIKFLLGRNVSTEIIKLFKLAYCDGHRLFLSDVIDDIWKKYLLVNKKNLSNHLIFPVSDITGSVAGVVFRGVNEKKFFCNKGFEKMNSLYGLNLALQDVHDKKFTIIVEGLFDCLVAHSLGFRNTVAVFGNRIAFNQACYIRRICGNALIIGDGDEGGRKLVMQGRKVLRGMGVNVKTMCVPNQDPDQLFLSGKYNFRRF